MKTILGIFCVAALLMACGPKNNEGNKENADSMPQTKYVMPDSPSPGEIVPADSIAKVLPEMTTGKPDTKPETKPESKPVKAQRYTVNGKWILETLYNQKSITKSFSMGNPNIEINTDAKTLVGFGGCNSLSASAELYEGTKLKIGSITSTKKYCAEVPENDFVSALNRTKNFSIEGGKLMLKDGTTKLATFSRPNE